MLHYIRKCIHLEWRWLFGPLSYMLIQIVWLIVSIISIPDEELFSETTVGCTASYFVKIIWCSCWFCIPPYFEAEYCLFCGRRRVAVARYRMICLVLTDFNHRRGVTCDVIDELRRFGLSKSCSALCHKLIYEITIFYSINGGTW